MSGAPGPDPGLAGERGGWGAWLPWLLACAAGLAVPLLIVAVRTLGRNVPQEAIETDYLAGVVWAAVIAVLILAVPVRQAEKRALLVLWAAKCFVTLGFMLLYEYMYGLDSYLYFRESLGRHRPSAMPGGDFAGGTELMAVLAWYHNWVLPDSFHTLKVSCSLVGLAAVYLVYRAVRIRRPEQGTGLLYALGLFPSVLFWSSVLGKDPLVLFGISLYTLGVVGWTQRRRLPYLIALALGVWIAATIRMWLAPILLLPMVVIGLRAVKGVFLRLALLGSVAGVVWLTVATFQEQLALYALQDVVSMTERMAGNMSTGGSGLEEQVRFSGIGDMVRYLPQGTFRALFRPLPGEVMNPFGLLAGVENLFLLFLVALAVMRVRLRKLRDPLVQWAVTLIVCWAGVYGFVSTNLGAAVRFKLQVLPTLLCLLLYLAQKDGSPAAAGVPGGEAGGADGAARRDDLLPGIG